MFYIWLDWIDLLTLNLFFQFISKKWYIISILLFLNLFFILLVHLFVSLIFIFIFLYKFYFHMLFLQDGPTYLVSFSTICKLTGRSRIHVEMDYACLRCWPLQENAPYVRGSLVAASLNNPETDHLSAPAQLYFGC